MFRIDENMTKLLNCCLSIFSNITLGIELVGSCNGAQIMILGVALTNIGLVLTTLNVLAMVYDISVRRARIFCTHARLIGVALSILHLVGAIPLDGPKLGGMPIGVVCAIFFAIGTVIYDIVYLVARPRA